MTKIQPQSPAHTRRRQAWMAILLIGLIAWVISIIATIMTRDAILVPTIILVGSFLMPITFLAWVFERQEFTSKTRDGIPSALDIQRIVAAFALSGLFGVSIAAVMETYLLANHPLIFYLGVALIEELIKMLLIVFMMRGLTYYTRRDGMVLGAAVGFGFAAFESAGYAFNTIIQTRSVDLASIIQTEVVRGLLTPVGHGLWSALIGGALFYAAAQNHNRIRLTGGVVGWFAVVVALHALWDMAAGIAVGLTLWLTHQPISLYAVERGLLSNPTRQQALLDGLIDWLLLSFCAFVGAILAYRQWRKGRKDCP